MNPPPVYLVLILGAWGRGATVAEAAKRCKEAGGRSPDNAVLYIVLRDEKPFIGDDGRLHHAAGSESHLVLSGVKLGPLLKSK